MSNQHHPSYGSVRGHLLWWLKALGGMYYFVLQDEMTGTEVVCTIDDVDESLLDTNLRINAIGFVYRDDRGFPKLVNAKKIEQLESMSGATSFEEVRGILYDPDDDEPSEDKIRRLRDA